MRETEMPSREEMITVLDLTTKFNVNYLHALDQHELEKLYEDKVINISW